MHSHLELRVSGKFEGEGGPRVSYEDTDLQRKKVSLVDIGETLIFRGQLRRYWSPEVTLKS